MMVTVIIRNAWPLLENSSRPRDGTAEPVPLCSSASVDPTPSSPWFLCQSPEAPSLLHAQLFAFRLTKPGWEARRPQPPRCRGRRMGMGEGHAMCLLQQENEQAAQRTRGRQRLGDRDSGGQSGTQDVPAGRFPSARSAWHGFLSRTERRAWTDGSATCWGSTAIPSSLPDGKPRLREVRPCWEVAPPGFDLGCFPDPLRSQTRDFHKHTRVFTVLGAGGPVCAIIR